MHALPPAPRAVAFRNATVGLLGTTHTIERTTDGGRTWRVVFRTPRPVASLTFDEYGRALAVLDDGETLGGPHWRPVLAPDPPLTPCPTWYQRAVSDGGWALCIGHGSAGNAGKAVYRETRRGWKRVAYTPIPPSAQAHGGIPPYGYAEGISMAYDGFGVIWEWRGTLYVTRDGGSHWTGLPKVAEPETDFGWSGWALPHGIAFVLLSRNPVFRLLETTDYGRTWHAVHRWG